MASSDLLQRKIAAWQSALIDLTRRNPLYTLSPKARGLLPLTTPAPDDLYQWVVRRRRPLQFDPSRTEADLFGLVKPSKPGHVSVGEAEFKTLNTLRLRAASALREQGINILFVAIGMLEWVEPDTRNTMRSPLLLVPVSLERLPGGDAFRLTRFEDEIETNPTLRFRLSQGDIRIPLPDLPDEEDLTPSAYLASVEAALPWNSGWKLTSEMVLGRFSFLKMTMYRDLSAQAERARNHPVVAALAGDRDALARLPSVVLPSVELLDEVTRGERSYQVLDADPTQQRAILAARRGQSFVLQGPPGTGKTQTIANVITECVAAGKRVLFVSQKMAALDAVFKRLRDKGLADLCLEAHSHKANKKEVLAQLRQALNARQYEVRPGDPKIEVLEGLRAALGEVVGGLHTPWQPLGLSVYEANGIVAGAADVMDLPFVFITPELVTADQYRLCETLAERLSDYHSLFAEIGAHPWRGIRAERFTLDLQTTVRTIFGDFYHQIEIFAEEARALAELCALDAPQNITTADHLLRVSDAAACSPHPPRFWLAEDQSTELRKTASSCQKRYQAHCDAKQALLCSWSEGFLSLSHAFLLERLGPQWEMTLRAALGGSWAERLAESYSEMDVAAQQTLEKIERLLRGLSGLASLTGRPLPLTPGAAKHESKVAALACQDCRPLPHWFNLETLLELGRRADEAAGIHQQYASGRDALFIDYGESVLTLDLPALQGRFTDDYDTILKYFKLAYYRDRKAIHLTLRPEAPRGARNLSADLALALQVRNEGEWIRVQEDELRASFGIHYQQLDTDWNALKAAIHQTAAVADACGGSVPPALRQRMIVSGLELEALRDQKQAVETLIQEADGALTRLGQWIDLTQLPFTNLPVSQAPLEELAAWLRQVRSAAKDYHGARQEALIYCISPNAPLPNTLNMALMEALRLVEEESSVAAEGAALKAQYQDLYAGLDTDWDKVLTTLDWTERFRQLYPDGPIQEGLLAIVTEAAPSLLADIADAQKTLTRRREAIRPLNDKLADLFPPERLYAEGLSFMAASFSAVAGWLKERLDRLPDLERWIDFQNLRTECAEAGLLSFFETAIHRQPVQEQILPAFRKQFHRLWLDGVTDHLPPLRRFRGEEHARVIARFCALDAAQIDLAPEGVRALVQGRKPANALSAMASIGEMGALKAQLSRQRPKAIRKLLADIPNLLFLLKPCLLMSPLSVSLFLESETIWFDTVIFDEASQVFTEDAVGAILRAKQVIIAGDTQQLPPTSFFQSFQADGSEDEEDEEESGAGEYESVLKAANAFADSDSPYFAEHPLNWHYRSHHESLIAFSKVHFYDRLIPYPSSRLPSAVTLDFVPEGIYYPGSGAPRNNPIEAGRVADLVVAHVRAHSEQSVGVITFNEAQQTKILAEIERRKMEMPEIAALLSEEGSEGFFVKNIENVQGDERDVIFLSIGFGHPPGGRLSMNFGPLNKDGGERRLNVAVTRARRQMTVVASIRSGDIDLSRTEKKGPALLKAYLEFAERGTQGAPLLSADSPRPQSAFESAVETALRRRGYQVRRQIGLFDYRVDLAIVDDEDPSRYLLGIECDGPMYRDAPTARARERLRSQVLHSLEWRLLRLWSSDWVRDPERELARVAEAVKRIQAGEQNLSQIAVGPEPPATSETALGPPVTQNAESVLVSAVMAGRVEETKVSYTAATIAEPTAPLCSPSVVFFQRWTGTLPGGRASFYSEDKRDADARGAVLMQIVEVEGPLPLEAATQRLAEAAGIGRAGARVQEIVEETAESLYHREQIEQRGVFLWPRGMERPVPRTPRPQDTLRPFDFICLEEIGEAAVALLKVAYGMRRDELILETARLLGYRNTSANIRDRVNEALSALELDNRIQVVGGQIRALELS